MVNINLHATRSQSPAAEPVRLTDRRRGQERRVRMTRYLSGPCALDSVGWGAVRWSWSNPDLAQLHPRLDSTVPAPRGGVALCDAIAHVAPGATEVARHMAVQTGSAASRHCQGFWRLRTDGRNRAGVILHALPHRACRASTGHPTSPVAANQCPLARSPCTKYLFSAPWHFIRFSGP